MMLKEIKLINATELAIENILIYRYIAVQMK
jgi:hypothetical protein